MTVGTGQLGRDSLVGTAGTGLPGENDPRRDCRDGITRKGQPRQDQDQTGIMLLEPDKF